MMVKSIRVLLGMLIAIPAHSNTTPTVFYDVRVEHVWIPMKDGIRLAADLFMPKRAKPGEKFPAIFKYDPYRKDDNNAIIEECNLVRYFVARGYVGACVDIRGTGQSEGHVPNREYSEQELSDGEEIIGWLARQPWSSGAVAIFGSSWSGFNGLQLAMRQPPALKTVISLFSTEKLYKEDCYYTDGIFAPGDGFNFGEDVDNANSP